MLAVDNNCAPHSQVTGSQTRVTAAGAVSDSKIVPPPPQVTETWTNALRDPMRNSHLDALQVST